MDIDWTWYPDYSEMDLVWYGRSSDTDMLIASNGEFDCVVIGDSAEDVISFYGDSPKDGFGDGILTISPSQTALSVLGKKWRWFIHEGKVKFLMGGNGWKAESLAEFSGWQSNISPDPHTTCYFAASNSGPIKYKDCIVIGGSVDELTEQLNDLDINPDDFSEGGVHVEVSAFISMSKFDCDVWFKGKKHNVQETLKRNPYALVDFLKSINSDDESEDKK